jgi:hypothetical protein
MPPPESTARVYLRWIAAAVYVGLPAILVFGAVKSGEVLKGGDIIGIFYHLRGAVGKALGEGRLPVWEPHVMSGFPLLAGLQAAVFYPPSWPCIVLSPGVFWTTSAWLHLVLAGLFTHRWLERGLGLSWTSALVGGVLYQLSGYAAGHVAAGHMNYIWCYPWLPALLWRLERYLAAPTPKRGVLIAVVLAALFLAGVPQIVYFTGLVVLGRLLHFLLGRGGRAGRAAVAARAGAWLALGIVLSAPQLLPALELSSLAQRTSVNSMEFVTTYSVAPLNLLTLLVPTLFGDGDTTRVWVHGDIWESPGFVGIAGLALAALGVLGRGRQRYFWAAVAVTAVLMSLGRNSLLFRLCYHVIPGVGLFRAPSRYLLLFVLAVVPLAAMGVERLWRRDETSARHACIVAALAGMVMLAAVGVRWSLGPADGPAPGWWSELAVREGVLFQRDKEEPAPPDSRPMAARSLVWAAVCSATVAGCLLVRQGPGTAAALGLLLAGELWIYSSRYYTGVPVDRLEWPAQFVDNVKHHPHQPFRIATVSGEQTPSIGMCLLAGIDHVGGYEPMMLRRYAEFCNVARGSAASYPLVVMVRARPSRLFNLLGARYWIVPGARQEPPGWKTVGELSLGFVYENPEAMPRAFLVGRSVVVDSPDQRLKLLMDPSFDVRRAAVLESPGEALLGGSEELRSAVKLAEMGPGRYVLEAECSAEAYLVLAESYYPGWTAEVDGAPATIIPADHVLQAVRLPAGRHEVRFTYRSRFLGLGFAIAAAGLAVPLGLMAWRRRRP